MKDQPKGGNYDRPLSPAEQALLDKVNLLGREVGKVISELQSIQNNLNHSVEIDGRWLAIGKTDLQKGFMALARSISKPEDF